MISLLTKWFIKDRENMSDVRVRRSYGVLCSVVGIALNLLLSAGKFFAGQISGSIAITGDAVNNLSDAGASVVTLLGFKFAGRKADRDHPFGHGRVEYIAGFIVSVIIILMGVELIRSSIGKIIDPSPVDSGVLPMIILGVSILIKLYMSVYNKRIGKKIGSSAMRATSTDSLTDALATTAVLISMLAGRFSGINIDGYCGVLVSLFILYAGYEAAKDTLSPLLGKAPDPKFVGKIRETVLGHDEVVGIHDIVVHDYGPGRVLVSLHAEVPAEGDMVELHEMIDVIERELEELGCEATIHMDPTSTDDEAVITMRDAVTELIKGMDRRLSLHDFRMVAGPHQTTLLFDVVAPFELELGDKELKDSVEAAVEQKWQNSSAIVKIDRSSL